MTQYRGHLGKDRLDFDTSGLNAILQRATGGKMTQHSDVDAIVSIQSCPWPSPWKPESPITQILTESKPKMWLPRSRDDGVITDAQWRLARNFTRPNQSIGVILLGDGTLADMQAIFFVAGKAHTTAGARYDGAEHCPRFADAQHLMSEMYSWAWTRD